MRNSRVRDYLSATKRLYEASSRLCEHLTTLSNGGELDGLDSRSLSVLNTFRSSTDESMEVFDASSKRLPQVVKTNGQIRRENRMVERHFRTHDAGSGGVTVGELYDGVSGRFGESFVEAGFDPAEDVPGPPY